MQTTKSRSESETALPLYIFASVEGKALDEVSERIQKLSNLRWSGRTSGRYDIVASLHNSELDNTYATIEKIRSIDGVTAATTSFVPFEGYTEESQEQENEDEPKAVGQVFLRVNRPIHEVVRSLKKIDGVSEALGVTGEWDVLATVRGASYEEILRKAFEEISQLDGVTKSETTFVYSPNAGA